jgi:WD40 repeat protein
VLLYGQSGAGKSSLINAGLIPAAEREGLRADRVRVQPRPGEELVVERLETTAEGGTFLPSSFGDGGDGDAHRIVLSTEAFRARLRELPPGVKPLLIFDQFEELATLFEDGAQGDGRVQTLAAQQRIVDLLVDLLRDETAPVKLLLVFREDYLAKMTKLLALRPELVDQSIRLASPEIDSLYEIVRGPFEKYPGHFERELSPELAGRLRGAIEARSGSGELNLSEVQIACLRLWESSDPDGLFEKKGVQGLLEEFLSESLERFPPELRDPAVALLSRMVTSSGTRNVVSAEGLVADVRDEEGIPEDLAKRALVELEQKTKLVRRERRRDVDLYEIASEFLLPWIQRQREERLAAQAARAEAERQRRVRRRLIAVAGGLGVLVLAFAAIAIYAVTQKRQADRQRASALASRAISESSLDPLAALVLADRAVDTANNSETQSALRTAFAADSVRAVLHGHTDAVNRAFFTPNGRRVVTAGDDGTVRIWNVTDRKAVHVLHIPGKRPVLDFSSDGKRVVTRDRDLRRPVVRVWDVATGRVIFSPRSGGLSAAFSANGKLLAVGTPEGPVLVFDLGSGRRLHMLRGSGPDEITSIAFSSDGKRVLAASAYGKVRIWNERTGRLLRVLIPGGRVEMAYFNPGGTLVATASGDAARLWRWRTGRQRAVLRHSGAVHSARFSHDGKLVVTAGDTTARLWDAATGASVAVLRGHGDAVLDASFSRDDRLVVTASADTTARVWSIRPAEGQSVLVGHRKGVYDASFSPDGSRILTASGDGTARIWNVQTGSQVAKSDRKIFVGDARYLPNGRSVVLGTAGAVEIWSPEEHRVHRLKSYSSELVGLDARSDEAIVAGLDVRSDGAIAVVLYGGYALIRERGRFRRLPGEDFRSAVFSPTGRRIVTAGRSGVKLWDTRTLKLLRRLPYRANVLFASFSPDGKRIATASADTTARIWDASTGKELRVLRGHTGSVTSARFSPNGRLVVTASKDHTVRVWNAETGAAAAIFADHTGIVWAASFSPDGRRIVTAGNDHTARIYTFIPIEELRRRADDLLDRSVTREEERAILEQP